LEIADTIGGADPARGLELIERAGWEKTRNFYAPVHVNGEEVSTNEGHYHAKAGPLRHALFRGLAITDPQAARDYLERVPRSFRSAFAKVIEAELAPETE
jgi:hypothetical protein